MIRGREHSVLMRKATRLLTFSGLACEIPRNQADWIISPRNFRCVQLGFGDRHDEPKRKSDQAELIWLDDDTKLNRQTAVKSIKLESLDRLRKIVSHLIRQL